MSKQCGTCTKCCDGTTSVGGDIFGHIYGNGKPCHFLNLTEKKCGIYKDRPNDPCKTYQCMWLKYEDVPLWMKPEYSNIIVSSYSFKGRDFLILTAMGKDYSAKYLSYVINYAKNNSIPLMYEIGQGIVFLNEPDFFQNALQESEVFNAMRQITTHGHTEIV